MEDTSKPQEIKEENKIKKKLSPKIIAIAILSLMLLFVLCICCLITIGLYKGIGSNNVVTERRAVKEFMSITIDTPGTIYFTQGDVLEVKIEGEDNIVPQIVTEVKNDSLNIRFKRRFPPVIHYFTRKPINYYITAPNLSKLTVNGDGKFEAESLKTSTFDLNINGSGNVNLAIDAFQINTTVEGNADIELKGTTKNQLIKINGKADINNTNLSSETTDIEINGSGQVYVNAQKELDVNINGKGDVFYTGDPSVTQEINGSGKVEKYN